MPDTMSWFPLIIGILFLLGGWLLYWLSISLSGAVILGGTGLLIVDPFLGKIESEVAAIGLQAGGVILGALLGMLLARMVHKLAFFLVGCVVGAAVFAISVSGLQDDLPLEWMQTDAFFAFGIPIAGVICGFLSVVFSDYVVIGATSLVGTGLVMMTLNWPYSGIPAPILVVIGIVIQLSLSRPFRKRGRQDG